jgi:hypothetical protein
MLYFTGAETEPNMSIFTTAIVKIDHRTGLPCYGEMNTELPINIKPGCDYLGACWLDLDINLSTFFPADVHPDGYPFGDRVPWGFACTPRAAYVDFPTKDGKFKRDMRIGYIRCGTKNDEEIVILGGTDFSITNITEHVYRNFHHYFIDITGRNRTALVPVLDEPAEIARRPHVLLKNIRPPGSRSAWEGPRQRLMDIANQYVETDEITDKDVIRILDNVPTRGYLPDIPTFEVFSHAALSGNMYAAAFEVHSYNASLAMEIRTGMVRQLDDVLDDLTGWNNENQSPQDLHALLGDKLATLQRSLVKHLSVEESFQIELQRAMDGIPLPGLILNHLPDSILPGQHRTLSNLICEAIRRLGADTNTKIIPRIRLRAEWNTPNPTDDGYSVNAPDRAPYKAPFKSEPKDPRTDGLLQELFRLPVQNVNPAPRTPKRESPDLDEDALLSPESLRKKRRLNKLRSQQQGISSSQTLAGPSSQADSSSHQPDSSSQADRSGTLRSADKISHTTHKWSFTNPGLTSLQPYARTMCKDFGLPRQNKIAHMIDAVTTKINTERLGLTQLGKKYGTMIPKTP